MTSTHISRQARRHPLSSLASHVVKTGNRVLREKNHTYASQPASSYYLRERRDEDRKFRGLPARVHPQGDTKCAVEIAKRVCPTKPNESHLPVLLYQINFTLSHLPATVMSFIHPFPGSHGNSVAWSCSFFCISLSFCVPPPLLTPEIPAHLLHMRGTVTPPSPTGIQPPLFARHVPALA